MSEPFTESQVEAGKFSDEQIKRRARFLCNQLGPNYIIDGNMVTIAEWTLQREVRLREALRGLRCLVHPKSNGKGNHDWEKRWNAALEAADLALDAPSQGDGRA